MKKKNSVIMKRLIERHRHFLMYVLIGVIATAVDMLIFFLLSDVLGLHYIISNIISVFVGIFTSFELNSRFNFKKTNLRMRRLISFTVVCLLGMAMGSLLLALFYSQLGITKYIAKVLSVILAGVFQYLFNKNITFKK